LKTDHFFDFDAKVQPKLNDKVVNTYTLIAHNAS